jgi:type II secretion system protein G
MVRKIKNGNRGFTLIELMVVVIILGILALYIGPKIMGEPEKAKRVKAKMDIASLETALKMYKLDNGVYPAARADILKKIKSPKTPGEMNLYTFLPACMGTLTLFPMHSMVFPAAKVMITRILITGK